MLSRNEGTSPNVPSFIWGYLYFRASLEHLMERSATNKSAPSSPHDTRKRTPSVVSTMALMSPPRFCRPIVSLAGGRRLCICAFVRQHSTSWPENALKSSRFRIRPCSRWTNLNRQGDSPVRFDVSDRIPSRDCYSARQGRCFEERESQDTATNCATHCRGLAPTRYFTGTRQFPARSQELKNYSKALFCIHSRASGCLGRCRPGSMERVPSVVTPRRRQNLQYEIAAKIQGI